MGPRKGSTVYGCSKTGSGAVEVFHIGHITRIGCLTECLICRKGGDSARVTCNNSNGDKRLNLAGGGEHVNKTKMAVPFAAWDWHFACELRCARVRAHDGGPGDYGTLWRSDCAARRRNYCS